MSATALTVHRVLVLRHTKGEKLANVAVWTAQTAALRSGVYIRTVWHSDGCPQ